MAKDVFILGGKRTPMGEYVGALKDISAIELGAIAAGAALEATRVSADEIDHTVIGNAHKRGAGSRVGNCCYHISHESSGLSAMFHIHYKPIKAKLRHYPCCDNTWKA